MLEQKNPQGTSIKNCFLAKKWANLVVSPMRLQQRKVVLLVPDDSMLGIALAKKNSDDKYD